MKSQGKVVNKKEMGNRQKNTESEINAEEFEMKDNLKKAKEISQKG